MIERPANPKENGQRIRSGIRAVLLNEGSKTKAELSERLGISFPTASKFLTLMENDGELSLVGLDESSGGRRAQRYAYNPDYRLGLAVILEKTETYFTLYNGFGEIKDADVTSSFLTEGVEKLAAFVESVVDSHPSVGALAIGVPASVDNGRIIYTPGYETYRGFDLKRYLEARFSIPVLVENDMNAAVRGYYKKRSIASPPTMVYLYFGQNGPGAGILVNGDVVRGSTFFAGEVSFVPQYDDRNFLQALTGSEASGSPRWNEGDGVDAVGRLVAAISAILNPDTFIFSDNEVDPILLESIAQRSAAYFPREHLPKLTASDWKEDYLYGLRQLGIELMIAAPARSDRIGSER
ncbi:ROK family transcriptional regulator [Paenibacillus flagellatus]|uniref:ROK family transcriptional regulator n=1 Tax=Paenibacillus flagellatus TaxID=2211139 RepID=A0A2V5K102_9BACL|nr:ROK family transcriptional regulator [Paenibacillus flagellatus]PYI51384.1 hypothetical protein DLM86_25510 [Paenibacillus flagellatus]